MGLFDSKEERERKELEKTPLWARPDPEVAHRVGKKAKTLEEKARITTYIVCSLVAFVTFLFMMATALGATPWHARYATDFFLVFFVFAAGPYGVFYNRDLRRLESIDAKFPEFLRDLAESARAGMTLPRALVNASRGTYGGLTPEIQKMSAQVEWGVPFSEALERFAQRARSPLIKRIVSLIIEAQRAGGAVTDVLAAAADDAREIRQITVQRRNSMQTYGMVIYIAFFVFIAVVLVLQGQFIPAFKEAAVASKGANGGVKDFEPDDFNTIFFHAAIVQGIGGGLVGGVLTRGNPIAGMRTVAIMLGISWFSFRVVTGVLV